MIHENQNAFFLRKSIFLDNFLWKIRRGNKFANFSNIIHLPLFLFLLRLFFHENPGNYCCQIFIVGKWNYLSHMGREWVTTFYPSFLSCREATVLCARSMIITRRRNDMSLHLDWISKREYWYHDGLAWMMLCVLHVRTSSEKWPGTVPFRLVKSRYLSIKSCFSYLIISFLFSSSYAEYYCRFDSIGTVPYMDKCHSILLNICIRKIIKKFIFSDSFNSFTWIEKVQQKKSNTPVSILDENEDRR